MWETWGVKKPSLKITKGLGEMPVEGVCTACQDAVFVVKGLPLNPTVEKCTRELQEQFNKHFKKVHLREDASQAAVRVVREATEDK